jgi:Family of unknown function (DUF6186)
VTWRSATFVVWALLALSVAGLWLAASLGRGAIARPGPLLLRTCPPIVRRAALLLAWMWLGWHLFAR